MNEIVHLTEGQYLLIRATILRRNRYRILKCKECITKLSALLRYSILKMCDQIVKKRFVGDSFDSTYAFRIPQHSDIAKTRYFYHANLF